MALDRHACLGAFIAIDSQRSSERYLDTCDKDLIQHLLGRRNVDTISRTAGDVIGFVCFRFVGTYAGVLTVMSPQRRAMAHHTGLSFDKLLFLDVLEAIRFVAPVPLVREGLTGLHGMGAAMTPENQAECLQQVTTAGVAVANEVSRLTQAHGSVIADPKTCLCIPVQFAVLVAAGLWTELAATIKGRWPTASDIYQYVKTWMRYELAIGSDANDEQLDETTSLFDPQFFLQLAEQLKLWRGPIEASGADHEETIATLEGFVFRLEKLAEASQPDFSKFNVSKRRGRGGYYFGFAGEHGEYSADFLARVFLFAIDLRVGQSSHIRIMAERAFQLLPFPLRELINRTFQGEELPSAPMLSRANLFVDVAYMRVMARRHRQLLSGDAVLYGLSDGSPQGGREYQCTEYYAIKAGRLSSAGDAAMALKRFPKDPGSVLEGQLEEMHILMEVVRDARMHHVFPPMLLGARRQGLSYKGACVTHGIRIETLSWDDTAGLVNLFFSFTNDSGIEKQMNRTRFENLDAFYYWRPARVVDEHDLQDIHADAAPADYPTISFNHVIDVDGLFHAVELIQKRMLSQLPCWKPVKPLLESACVVFHSFQSRNRFKRGLHGPWQLFRDEFESGPPVLEGGRVWGVVHKATTYFLDRRQVLQANFHQIMVVADDAAGHEEGDDMADDWHVIHSAHVARTDEAFHDNVFWASIALINLFSQWLGTIEHWMQSCICHPRKLRDHFDLHLDTLKCPLRGCLAPRLANGALPEFGTTLFTRLFNILDGVHMEGLRPADRSKIVDQYNVGKEYSFVELSIRSRGWRCLPLRAFGMADHDEDKAIDALLISLALFEAFVIGEFIDSLSWTLFARDGPLRGQVLAVAQRQVTWEATPDLKKYRDVFQFMPVIEVSVERLHAVISSGIRSAPNHSVAYTSVQALRKNEIISVFDRGGEEIEELKTYLGEEARNANVCLETLGLDAHPSLDQWRAEGTLGNVPHNIATDIIYRGDIWTQFLDLEVFPELPQVPPRHPLAPPEVFADEAAVMPPPEVGGADGDVLGPDLPPGGGLDELLFPVEAAPMPPPEVGGADGDVLGPDLPPGGGLDELLFPVAASDLGGVSAPPADGGHVAEVAPGACFLYVRVCVPKMFTPDSNKTKNRTRLITVPLLWDRGAMCLI